jgi:hypothetical protein
MGRNWYQLIHFDKLSESIATAHRSLHSVPKRDISGFSRFPANESLGRTGLHLSLSAKCSFYLPMGPYTERIDLSFEAFFVTEIRRVIE